MIRRLTLLICSCLIVLVTLGQSGNYFITNHPINDPGIDKTIFSLEEDSLGIIHITNRDGIASYDGQKWDLIKAPGAVFSLKIDDQNRAFVGGSFGFGMFTLDYKSTAKVEVLSKEIPSAVNIFQVEIINDLVYFLNQKAVFIYDPEDHVITQIGFLDPADLVSIMSIGESIILTTNDDRIFEIDKDEIRPSDFNLPDQSGIYFTDRIDSEKWLAQSFEDKLYIIEGSEIRQLQVNDSTLISNNELTSVIQLGDLIVLGTVESGVMFFDHEGALVKVVNFNAGLPDNEVLDLTKETNGGIWVAHAYGLTLISPQLPFKNLASYSGLKGNILSVKSINDQFYAGTNTGLYFLQKQEVYNEVTYYVSVNRRGQDLVRVSQPKKKKRGLLSFLKKKDEADKAVTTSQEAKLEKRTRLELQSIDYQYIQVDNINSKVPQLHDHNGILISMGANGVFEVTGTNSIEIHNQPVRFGISSEIHNRIIFSTLHNEVFGYYKEGDQWIEDERFHEVDDFIQFISENKDGAIWLVSADAVYEINLDKGFEINYFDLDNPGFKEIYTFQYDGQQYFIDSDNFFVPDRAIQQIIPEDKLSGVVAAPEQVIVSSDNRVWIKNEDGWTGFGENEIRNNAINTLSLFKTPVAIEIHEDSVVYMATADNNIYRFNIAASFDFTSSHQLLLKEISNLNKKVVSPNNFKINQQESDLTIEFVRPDYSKILGIEYRYLLSGLNKNWSDWSEINQVNFAFLPPGDYELSIQARDLFGNHDTIPSIQFKVIPPYWRQSWFYALEVVFFGALFILSFRLNRYGRRYRILSRLLAFLTLILMVEFVQTVAEYSFEAEISPVADFFIQVAIALVILPLEALLRKLFFKSSADLMIKETKP